jgi:hypothetical protein
VSAQLGFRFGAVLESRDRAQRSVETADTAADDAAQHGYGMVRALARHEGVLCRRHAISFAKKAAAFLKIRFSSSSRLFY